MLSVVPVAIAMLPVKVEQLLSAEASPPFCTVVVATLHSAVVSGRLTIGRLLVPPYEQGLVEVWPAVYQQLVVLGTGSQTWLPSVCKV